MKNFNYDGQRFKNGNLNIRFSPAEIADINSGKYSMVELFLWDLEKFDTYLIGEEYCISNYEMGVTCYSCYADKVFHICLSDLDTVLMAGKTLKLIAVAPSEAEREDITKWEEG